jgi:hypothetical protein
MSLPKGSYPAPRLEAWSEVSVKLASLIEAGDFTSITEYYRQLRRIQDLKEDQASAAEHGEPVSNYLSRLEDLTQEARQRLTKYANPPSRAWWLGF